MIYLSERLEGVKIRMKLNPLNLRVLSISSMSSKNCKSIPSIRLQGKWLESLGFLAGEKVIVEQNEGEVIIRCITRNIGDTFR